MTKKLSIGTWAYAFGPYQDDPVPFDTVIEKLGALKYDGVEIGAFKPHVHPDDYPTDEDRAKVVAMIKDAGLEVSGLAADFWNENGPATDGAQEGDFYVNLFKKNIKLCTDLGSPSIRVDTVSPPDGAPGVDRDTAWKRIVDLWKTCAGIAQDAGVKMVWEFEPGFLFNKPSEVVQLVEDVGHPNFSVLFDTCHAYMCGVVGAYMSFVFLLVELHGVLQTVRDPIHKPVIVFGSAALVAGVGAAGWCNYFYGRVFASTVLAIATPLVALAYFMSLLFDPGFLLRPGAPPPSPRPASPRGARRPEWATRLSIDGL